MKLMVWFTKDLLCASQILTSYNIKIALRTIGLPTVLAIVLITGSAMSQDLKSFLLLFLMGKKKKEVFKCRNTVSTRTIRVLSSNSDFILPHSCWLIHMLTMFPLCVSSDKKAHVSFTGTVGICRHGPLHSPRSSIQNCLLAMLDKL